MPTADHHDRRQSDWAVNEQLVLTSLENLRVSSDAALKAVNEMNLKLVKIEGRIEAIEKNGDARILAIENKVDKMERDADERQGRLMQWVVGTATVMGIFIAEQIYNYFAHIGGK